MPEFLFDWHMLWLNFWHDHPVLYWTAGAIVVGITILQIAVRR